MGETATIAAIIWCIGAGVFSLLRIPHFRRARREATAFHRRTLSDWLLLRFAEIGFGVLPVVYVITGWPRLATYPFVAPFALLGGVLFLAGIAIIHRAHRDLGRGFSGHLEIRREHPLATAGIYRHVRHPMYLAYLFWALAQVLLLPNWIAGPAALVAWVALFSVRIPREEAMMIEAFGEEYRAYMARTARLVPGVF